MGGWGIGIGEDGSGRVARRMPRCCGGVLFFALGKMFVLWMSGKNVMKAKINKIKNCEIEDRAIIVRFQNVVMVFFFLNYHHVICKNDFETSPSVINRISRRQFEYQCLLIKTGQDYGQKGLRTRFLEISLPLRYDIYRRKSSDPQRVPFPVPLGRPHYPHSDTQLFI